MGSGEVGGEEERGQLWLVYEINEKMLFKQMRKNSPQREWHY